MPSANARNIEHMKPILVVGAGFSGATIARFLAEAGYSVEVIDCRDHIGGNAFDYTNEHGIRIHKYGPHLFHTNSGKVVKWLSRFTEWVPYQHRVKAILNDGRYVTLPVNRETKEIVGEENILDIFFRPYTKKMWGVDLEDLDPSIVNRIPVRDDDNELYFPNDEFQSLPERGYTHLFENMLDHSLIKVQLNCQFERQMESEYQHVFNSMPIDVYYEKRFGDLPYRSIRFHHLSLPLPRLLPTTSINFTHDGPYTRITEWKNLPGHGRNACFTSLTYEEPCDYLDNNEERYYPVKDVLGENKKKYLKYKSIPNPQVTFIGRCGLYAYIDMDQAVSSALSIAEKSVRQFQN